MSVLPWDRYGPGQRFGKHVDDSVDLGGGLHTEYTLLLYLTGSDKSGNGKVKGKPAQSKAGPALAGGETIFYGVSLNLTVCRADALPM